MQMLLSVTLALLMVLTPVLATVDVGPTPAHAQSGRSAPLSVPVVARVTPEGGTATDAAGTLTITRFAARDNDAVALGTLTSPTATGAMVIPVSMNVVRGAAETTQQAAPAQITQDTTCQILNLTLGPLTLNLLGLVVEIPNPVVLNIFAVQGAGNLLGNLLCAITGLLDGTGAVGQLVAALNNLVGALNNL